MDARQWSRAAWALALLFGSLPFAGAYFHVRSRRFATRPDPATLLEHAHRLAASGRPDRALAVLTRTIRQSPRLWQAYQYRGELRLRLGDRLLAAEDFSDAIRLAPEEPHLHALLEDATRNS